MRAVLYAILSAIIVGFPGGWSVAAPPSPDLAPHITACDDQKHPVHMLPVTGPGVAFYYGEQQTPVGGGAQTCIAYVVVNRESKNWLRVAWDDVIVLAPGATLQPDAGAAPTFACGAPVRSAVCITTTVAAGDVGDRQDPFRYGRDLQTQFMTDTYHAMQRRTPGPSSVQTYVRAVGGAFEGTKESVNINLHFASALAADPAATYRVAVLPIGKELNSRVRVDWYPRSDPAFKVSVHTSGKGGPYLLGPSGVDVPWADYRRPAAPAVHDFPAAIWVGERHFLTITVPAIVPISQ